MRGPLPYNNVELVLSTRIIVSLLVLHILNIWMDWSIDYYRGRGKGILKLQHVQRSFARTWGKTMVVGGYIAHHQVHTIFQPLPRKVPPDHMCHKWPIGRACSGFRTLNWSLRFFLPNKPLRTLRTFFLCGRLWDTGSQIFCWKKNWRKIGILCPEIGCKKKNGL